MLKIKEFFNKLSKEQKVNFLVVIVIITIILSVSLPSLSRLNNRTTLTDIEVWDGTVATSYREGTGIETDPYIISNGSELAYFNEQLETTDYSNTYFKLNSDIALNGGIFGYTKDDGISYTLEDTTYYIKPYTNNYFIASDLSGESITTNPINIFDSLDNFNGHLDGNSYTIYGLYITDQVKEELGLFTNLNGTITNLYVENSLIYGGNITGGIASSATSTSISNTLFDGYVISNSETNPTVSNNTLEDVQVGQADTSTTQEITLPTVADTTNVVSTTLTGSFSIIGATSFAINGITVNDASTISGDFEVALGDDVLSSVTFTSSGSGVAIIVLNNLSYNITYDSSTAGGIVGKTNNVTLKNVVNKAFVSSKYISGGIVGDSTDKLVINQSYNTGNITSDAKAGGIVGSISNSINPVEITETYNNGEISATKSAGLISVIKNNTGNISITNSFNAKDNIYILDTVKDSIVSILSSYQVGNLIVKEGSITGSFSTTTIEDLKEGTLLKTSTSFNEYISNEDVIDNPENVWIFEDNSLPILYIDDISNPIANIHASTYSWNNFSTELNTVVLNNNISFSVEQASSIRPLTEISYYISNGETPLTLAEVKEINSWNTYENVVTITEEGYYIIYAKVIDYSGNITYLNSDILLLDMTGSNIEISFNDSSWTSYHEALDYIYIASDTLLEVTATDILSGVESINYYVADNNLTQEELEQVTDWMVYPEEGINFDVSGTHIIYIKVVDNGGYITYANTDYISYNGYKQSLYYGYNGTTSNNDIYITNKSAFTIKTTYVDSNTYVEGYKHNIITNHLLPIHTSITLIDYKTLKVYEYVVNTELDEFGYETSCDGISSTCEKYATYPLTLFKEIGNENDIFFEDSTFYTKLSIDEEFGITVDFINTEITSDLTDISLYMQLADENNVLERPTITSEIKKVNIYSNGDINGSLSLTSNYNSSITFNSDSTNNISLSTGVNYSTIDNHTIMDTTYEDKQIGLYIKIVDKNGVNLSKEDLKSVQFKIGNKEYIPNDKGTIEINLNTGLAQSTTTLTITTYAGNIDVSEGLYSLDITGYTSYDGLYSNNLSTDIVSIPVNVTNELSNDNYNFNVKVDDSSRIINSKLEDTPITFNLITGGFLTNPDVKVALYKKTSLTAYNQDYTLVNLQDYVSNTFSVSNDYAYSIIDNVVIYDGTSQSINEFILNLNGTLLEKTGYKLVFTLYDNNKLLSIIEKYFIVK